MVSKVYGFLFAISLGVGAAHAQTSAQDKTFLDDTAKDTNYEIKTGQLALHKSSSADVKQYATMVVHDHTALKPQIRTADAAAKVQMPGPDSLTVSDRASYTELEVLSGELFDKAYIKGLVKGNQQAVDESKSEASDSTVPAVKALAKRRLALDTKHTEAAKKLAQAHGIQP